MSNALSLSSFATTDYVRGLVPIDTRQKIVKLDHLIETPVPQQLNPDTEYALLMKRKDETKTVKNRIAGAKTTEELFRIIDPVIDSIAAIHNRLLRARWLEEAGTITDKEAAKYASSWAIQKKAKRNLIWDEGETRQDILTRLNAKYVTPEQKACYLASFHTLLLWQNLQREVFSSRYVDDFNQRAYGYLYPVQGRHYLSHIVRGHGDMHTENVLLENADEIEWLDPLEVPDLNTQDVIADAAMFMVTAQADIIEHFKPSENIDLANFGIFAGYYMQGRYLGNTDQQRDMVAKRVFSYYAADKAFVRATRCTKFSEDRKSADLLLVIGDSNMREVVANIKRLYG